MIDDTEIEDGPSARDLVAQDERGVSRSWVEQRASNDGDGRSTLFVASMATPDRAMDVVAQDWRLAAFRSNPVILDNHNPIRVVGQGLEARVPKDGEDAGRLMIRVGWDLDNPDPTIRAVGHQHLNGIRRAGSVGFRPGKRTRRDKLPTDHPHYQEGVDQDLGWGTFKYAGTLYERNELLEFSSATIPMHPSALQRALGELDPGDTRGRLSVVQESVPRDLAGELHDLLTGGGELARGLLDLLWADLGVRARGQLLELARTDTELRRILRAALDAGPPRRPAALRGDGLDHLFQPSESR